MSNGKADLENVIKEMKERGFEVQVVGEFGFKEWLRPKVSLKDALSDRPLRRMLLLAVVGMLVFTLISGVFFGDASKGILAGSLLSLVLAGVYLRAKSEKWIREMVSEADSKLAVNDTRRIVRGSVQSNMAIVYEEEGLASAEILQPKSRKHRIKRKIIFVCEEHGPLSKDEVFFDELRGIPVARCIYCGSITRIKIRKIKAKEVAVA